MKTPLPCLLLVEDDPVSQAFLHAAATALPAQAWSATSMAGALALANVHAPDLLLVDAHLPDGDGASLLHAMRAMGVDAHALAHTASPDATVRERLLQAGYREVLAKPMGVADLHAALRRHLHGAGERMHDASAPDWNDAGALAALGEPSHVGALRNLFLAELPAQRERIALAGCDDARVDLHRLAASCGFVGADRLGEAVRALQAHPRDADAMQGFLAAAEALIGPRR